MSFIIKIKKGDIFIMYYEENTIMISATTTGNLAIIKDLVRFTHAYHQSLQYTKGRIPVFIFRGGSRMEYLLVGFVRELNLKDDYITLEMLPPLFEEFSKDTGTIPGFIFPHIEKCFYTDTYSLPYFVYIKGEDDLVDKQYARSSTIVNLKKRNITS